MHMWGPGASARARPRPRTWTRGAECASTPQVAGEEQAGEHVHELKPQELRSRLKPRDAKLASAAPRSRTLVTVMQFARNLRPPR